jgi:acyl dehydratase/NAD(P)-dependent dehydrogenase (short-subunit alcohol dehydrogenase family)
MDTLPTETFAASRCFDDDDQQRFAIVSGDRNPMHMDEIAARRTQAGGRVVHGVHIALWVLDELCAAGRVERLPRALAVQFKSFVFVGDLVNLTIARETAETLRAEVRSSGVLTTTVKIVLSGEPRASTRDVELEETVDATVPRDRRLEELRGDRGRLAPIDAHAVGAAFPAAARVFGAERLASLVLQSTLVGMICPGLHSIFGGFEIDVTDDEHTHGLRYAVASVDERFSMIETTVHGFGLHGTIVAFRRYAPVEQRTFRDVAECVPPDLFLGKTALVVGGSRGLGALTAKMFAAGGGHAIVTYRVGADEARAVVADIGAARASTIAYDAMLPPRSQTDALDRAIDFLFYFASSTIYRPKADVFVGSRFAEFCSMYVVGFGELVAQLQKRQPGRELVVLYPSSVFVTDHTRDMTEYAMAKAAGEMLCADINRFGRNVRAHVERLPMMLTDQTATVVPMETRDPLEVLLPIMHRLAGR